MLSSQFLIDQKQCCGNGCMMCPYEPRHIQGNQQLQKRWNQSEKKSYTTHMNKINIPMIGLGTWLIPNDEAESITKDAINLGYKHIDTAQVYQNEEGIGNALKSLAVQGMKFISLQKCGLECLIKNNHFKHLVAQSKLVNKV